MTGDHRPRSDAPEIARARQIIRDHLASRGRAMPEPLPPTTYTRPRAVPDPIPDDVPTGSPTSRYRTLTTLLVESGDLTPKGARKLMTLTRAIARE